MKQECFDEGVFQAFLDGELASEMLEKVVRHLSVCENCTSLLNEVEKENIIVFDHLDCEFNSLVPTERIRTNLFQEIAKVEKEKKSISHKIWRYFSFLSNPGIPAFASLAIILGGFFVILFNFPQLNKDVAKNQSDSITTNSQPESSIISLTESSKIITETIENKASIKQDLSRVSFKQTERKFDLRPRPVENHIKPVRVVYRPDVDSTQSQMISGEKVYVKTISNLENSIKNKKDDVLRVSSRISFERDLAVIDDSIKKMRSEVKKNPKNEAAKQILMNSYQNKIDLLNSVSERNELMARLD